MPVRLRSPSNRYPTRRLHPLASSLRLRVVSMLVRQGRDQAPRPVLPHFSRRPISRAEGTTPPASSTRLRSLTRYSSSGTGDRPPFCWVRLISLRAPTVHLYSPGLTVGE